MRWITLITVLFLSVSSSAETLRYGYDSTLFKRFDKKDVQITLSVWLQEMVKGTPNSIESLAYDDMEMMAKDLKDDKINIVTTSALNFIKFFDRDMLEGGFAAVNSRSDLHRLLLVTRADSPVKSWQDLEDATIYALEGNDMARLYVDTAFLQRRLSGRPHWTDTDSYQQSLLKLFFNKGDAAIVTKKAFDLAVEMNPQMRQRLKVFDKSSMTDLIPSFFRKGMDKGLKKDIIATTLSLTTTVRGRQILSIFRSDSIDTISVESLIPVDKAYKSYLRLLKDQERTVP